MHEVILKLIDHIKRAEVAREWEILGCTESEVASLELLWKCKLPVVYRDFLLGLGKQAGGFLRGTSIFYRDLCRSPFRPYFEMLLKEAQSSFVLPETAVIFGSHQGYVFFYFDWKLGEDDPAVYIYEEGSASPASRGNFSQFLFRSLEGDLAIKAYNKLHGFGGDH